MEENSRNCFTRSISTKEMEKARSRKGAGFVECRVCGAMFAHDNPAECAYGEMACPRHRSPGSTHMNPKYACFTRKKELGIELQTTMF